MITFTLTVFTVVFGTLMLYGRNVELLAGFLWLGYAATLVNMGRSVRLWRDWLNPLVLILTICMVRFSIGAALMPEEGKLPVALFNRIGLQSEDWLLGHVLGVTGWLAFALGWTLVPGRWCRAIRLAPNVSRPVMFGACVSCAIGFFSLGVFVISNGATLDVIASGHLRGMEVRSGTGVFFHLSLLLIAGSIVWSAYLFGRLRHRLFGFGPVIAATLVFGTLGGRALALTPFVAGLLLYWYRRREEEGWGRMPTARYIAGLVSVPVGLWIAHFGQLYRGLGFAALNLSIWTFWQYLQYAVFIDVGGLISLAGAVSVEPAGLEGRSFYGLLWPLSEFLELPGKSASLWMTQQLLGGFGDRKWGINSSLIGDAYMNFGVLGVPLVMGIFGAALKYVYVGFRTGRVHAVPYVIVVVFALQIVFASFNKWGQMNLVLIAVFAVFLAGKTFLDVGLPARAGRSLEAR